MAKHASVRVRVQKLANTVMNVGDALMECEGFLDHCAEFRKFADYCDFVDGQLGAFVQNPDAFRRSAKSQAA